MRPAAMTLRFTGRNSAGRSPESNRLGRLPVRVATARGVEAARARATFDVTEYDVHGRELVEEVVEARVAG